MREMSQKDLKLAFIIKDNKKYLKISHNIEIKGYQIIKL